MCASCLGYDALHRGDEAKEDAEEAVMLESAGGTTKARMGILKIKKRKEEEAQVEEEEEEEAVLEGQKEGLLQCKTGQEEEEEEGDSGACVDEYPAHKDAEEGGGEVEKATVPSGDRDDL